MALLMVGASDGVYLRVERPRVFGKYKVAFELMEYIYHPVTGERVEASRVSMECDYDIEGPNLLEQCYVYAKGAVSFGTIDC